VDLRCDDPSTVIGSHPEQRPGRGRGRSLPCHNGPTPALRRLAAITPPRHGGVAFRWTRSSAGRSEDGKAVV